MPVVYTPPEVCLPKRGPAKNGDRHGGGLERFSSVSRIVTLGRVVTDSKSSNHRSLYCLSRCSINHTLINETSADARESDEVLTPSSVDSVDPGVAGDG